MKNLIEGVVLTIRFPEPIDKKTAELAIPLIILKNRNNLFRLVDKAEWIEGAKK